jgi:hypothetical protein
MRTIKLTALAAAIVTFASLPVTPAAAAGPLLVPWAVGHVISAAARLATLPLVAASAASSAGPPVYPAGPRYGAAGAGYPPPAYYQQPAYYPQPVYSQPPVYYRPPAYYPAGGYYTAPGTYYLSPRYGPTPAYRTTTAFIGQPGRFSESPRGGYYAPGMRYAPAYGGHSFGRARSFTYRRW